MIAPSTRELVRLRAQARCEYCRLPQLHAPATIFHIDHIVAKKHRGGDDLENLAFACDLCNLHKGSDLSGIDQATGSLVRLYHPRQYIWSDHFSFSLGEIIGLSSRGLTTIWVLQMNTRQRLRARRTLALLGELD